MKKILVVIALLFSTMAYAQNPPAASISKIAWDQDAATLAEVQGLTFRYYPDNAAVGIVLVNPVCSGTVSPFQCEVSFPAFSPGSHSLTLTAGNLAGESVKSAPPLNFVFVVTPGTPSNIRIK